MSIVRFDPADVVGEGIRVLKRLATPGAKLERRTERLYALTCRGRTGRSLHVPKEAVDAFRRRDWLTPAGDEDFALSDAGLGWLRRTLAGEDPFLAQHGALHRTEVVADDGTTNAVTANQGESPLTLMRNPAEPETQPLVTDTQFLAGERLRRDFTLANLMPRLTVDLTQLVVSGRRGSDGSDLSDIVLAAKQRFTRALTALGPDLSNVAVDVCCHLKPLNSAADALGWPDAAALVVLKLALDRLAEHYGLAVTATHARTRAWHAADGAAGEVSPRRNDRGEGGQFFLKTIRCGANE